MRCCLAQQKRCPREIGTNHNSIRTRQVKAHLPGSTSYFHDSGVTGNLAIQQARKLASFRPRAQAHQTVARRIAWKRSILVEAADDIGARVAFETKVRNPIRRFVACL